MKSILHSTLTLFCFFPLYLFAQSDGDYRSFTTGNWNEAGTWERYNGGSMNWEPAGAAPGSGDGAIAIRNTHTVTANSTITTDQVTVESGGTLIVTSTFNLADGTGDDLVVNGTLNLQSGSLGNTGTIRIAMGGIFSMTTSNQKSLLDPVVNDGTIQWQDGDVITYANTSASITNNGTFTISGNGLFQDNGGIGSFTNNGTITKSSSGTTVFRHHIFPNPGTINVQAGTLSVEGSGAFTNTGTISVTAANFATSKVFNHNTGSIIQGSGSFTNSGTLNLNIDLLFPPGLSFASTGGGSVIQGSGNLTVNNDFTIDGNIQGAGTLTVNGNTTWPNGTLDRTFTIQMGRTLTFNSTFQVYLEAPLVNDGTLIWQDGAIVLYVNEGATFTNNGTFNINNNNLFQDNGGIGSITNTGTINKTSSGTTTFNNFNFSNPGTVNVQAGTIALGGLGSFSNTNTISLTAANLTTAVSFNHNTGGTINGTGTFTNSGTMNLNVDLVTAAGIVFSTTTGSTIQGSGHLTINNDFTLNGTIQGTGMLTVNGNTHWNGGNLDRTFTNQMGRTLTAGTSSIKSLLAPLTNNGEMNWQDGIILFYQNGGASFTNNGTFTINTNNLFQDNGGVSTVINHGLITKISTGTTNINNLNFTNSATGEIKGVGTIAFSASPFTNNGTIAPGLSPGIMTITGSSPLSANSTLSIEVNGNGGAGAADGHDELVYNNSLTLAGELLVTETDTTVSDTFTILSLTSGMLTGTFSSQTLPDNYTVQITSNEVRVIKQIMAVYCPNDTIVNTIPEECHAVINNLDALTDPPASPYLYQMTGATTGSGTGSVSGFMFNAGVTTVKYKLQSDTSIQCTFLVTVNDMEFPQITCPEDMEVDSGTVVNYTVVYNDNCAGEMLEQTSGLPSGSVFPVGLTTNTFVVTDDAGNSATCSFQVSVLGGPPPAPELTCPSDTSAFTQSTACSAMVDNIDATTDPPGAEYNYQLSGATSGSGQGSVSGYEFNAGVTTVLYSLVIDPQVQCSFTVTVTDTIPPTVSCPDNITLNADFGLCGSIYTYDISYADNCPSAMFSQSMGIASGDTFPVGVTTNAFLITDAAGNTATCSFTITVEDDEAPTISCPGDIAADINEVVNYSVTYEDNCSGAMLTQTAGLPSGSMFPEGATTNIFEVEDASGNTAICSFIVNVTEGGGEGDTIPIGKVGINTTDPMAMLHVKDSSVVFTGSFNLPSFPFPPPPVSGSGTRMMWYPERAAFRSGRVYDDAWDWYNVGYMSFATGDNTKAWGYGSTAIGLGATAMGPGSFASGYQTNASGHHSVATGRYSDATSEQSIAMGYSCNATGYSAIALGSNATASGPGAIATGIGTTANGFGSASFGNYSTAKGALSFATGRTRANGYASFTVGMFNDTIVGVQDQVSGETPLFTVGNGTQSARSNAMVVRFDGKTGIGTSTPERRLHVRNGVSGAASNSSAVGVFEHSSNVAINLLAPDASSSGIYFGNTQNAAHGGILYNSTTPFGLAFRVNGNSTKMVITSNGNTGIGTFDPQRKLEVAGDGLQAIRVSSTNSVQAAIEFKRSGSGHDWRIINNAGLLLFGQSTNDLSTVNEVVRMGGSSLTPASDNGVTLGNSSLRWTQVWAVNGTIQTSDGNDKENITSLTSGLSKIMKLNPVTYHWKDTCIDMHKPHLGFIAQELKNIVPEAVVTHEWNETPDGEPEWKETDKLGVNYSELIPLLTKALQEQQKLIEQQQQTIDMLLKRMEVVEMGQQPMVSGEE
jgi:hypothetical protein